MQRAGLLQCGAMFLNPIFAIMPFGDGWHPYFKTGTLVDRLQLILPECEEMEVDENLIPTGKTKPYKRFNELETIGKTDLLEQIPASR